MTRTRVIVALALAMLFAMAPGVALAEEIPLDVYAADIQEARELVDDAVGESLSDREATDLAILVNSLVPVTVDVETPTGDVSANHTIVRSLVAQLDAADTAEERSEVVADLQAHLSSLEAAIGEPAAEAVPQDPEALASLLGEQTAQVRTPFQELLARLIDRIARWLEKWWESVGQSEGAGSTFTMFVIAVVVAALLLLAFVLARFVVRWRAGLQRDTKGPLPPLAEDAVVVAARDLPADPLAYADERAAAGDMREAIRALFGGAARSLQEAGYIVEARTRTNRELLLEVRPRSEAVFVPLETLSREFERVWYGHQDLAARQYADARERFGEVRAALAAAAAGGDVA